MFNEDNGYPLAAEIDPAEERQVRGPVPDPAVESGADLQFAQAIEISLSDPKDI